MPSKFPKFVNQDFFDILTPESAWVSGLWITDGNIFHYKNNYGIRIGFSDKTLIETVYNLLETNAIICLDSRRNHQYWYFSIFNKHLYDSLLNHFQFDKKFQRDKLPKMPPDLLPHFIRGVIDGDGSIIIAPRRKTSDKCKISITFPNLSFLNNIRSVIKDTLNIDGYIITHKNAYEIVYGTLVTKTLTDWIYKDSENIRYEEKYQKYLKFS